MEGYITCPECRTSLHLNAMCSFSSNKINILIARPAEGDTSATGDIVEMTEPEVGPHGE